METVSQEFSDQKQSYFTRLGREQKQAFKLHKASGLWDREDGKKEWGNVSKHCLVEIARVDILANTLGLSEEITNDLKTAAALHDFYKKGEVQNLDNGGLNWASFEKSVAEAESEMYEAGFSDRVIRLASAIGHGHPKSIIRAEQLLNQPLSAEDMAFLIMHYVDSYTVGSDRVNSPETLEDGQKINDIDRRYLKIAQNPRINDLNEAGREYFHGETLVATQRRVAHLVEDKLAELVSKKNNRPIDPLDLPNFIDQELHARIEHLFIH